MKTTYTLISDTYPDEKGIHKGFGIAVMANTEVLKTAEDISCDEKSVAQLVRLCNNLELSPIHFWDVIDDFIG